MTEQEIKEAARQRGIRIKPEGLRKIKDFYDKPNQDNQERRPRQKQHK